MTPEIATMARYRFVTEWQAEAPIERVWDALLDYRQWPTWWKGFRDVRQIHPGDERGIGMTLRQGWRSRIPYTLTFDLDVTDVERRKRLEGRVTGDVEGTCLWTFQEQAGWTAVRFVMDVRTARPWMNIPVPFARQVFASNYDTIMRWGSEGISRLLGATVAHRSGEAVAAAA
jgi:uncharacterized protein YndB with AHSA1/START domain